MAKTAVEKMMRTLSNWKRWSGTDELGAANLITNAKRAHAASLVREGMCLSLARNTTKGATDNSPPFEHRMIRTGADKNAQGATDWYGVEYHGYTVTHLDALCHVFYQGHMYNGFAAAEVTQDGAKRLGVTRLKNGIFTRGILMDIPLLRGKPYLPGAEPIYREDLEAWERRCSIQVKSGDAIILRTGRWARRAEQGSWPIEEESAGLHASALPWLHERDVAVLASDLAADVMPSGIPQVKLPIHLVAIVAMGVPIIDNCDLEQLSITAAKQGRWEFLFVAAPLPVEGGTGSPINPLAVF
jgi:kynurenine formamidase